MVNPLLPRENDLRFQTMVDNMEPTEEHTLEAAKDMLAARGCRPPGLAVRQLLEPANTSYCNPKARRH